MLYSMTGFGSKEIGIAPLGKICLELRSTNHKFLEIVFHLPEGFLSLEDKMKKEIEAKIKRGRVVCAINISGGSAQGVFVNNRLLEKYFSSFKKIKKQLHLKEEVSINTLIHLPGVLSLNAEGIPSNRVWPRLKILLRQVLEDLAQARLKEGRALYIHLKRRAGVLKQNLSIIKLRFKTVIKEKLGKILTDEERSTFLKDTDITEEIERLAFHIRHFESALAQNGPVGKELDFVAQEMQREANTAGAKSCDGIISLKVVQLKSQIEKIREQLQNIE
jgi:uncharacterized protein (TIGR00255 family)